MKKNKVGIQLVEKHVISESNKDFRILDELCYKSKNLYNIALYTVRQEYIFNKKYLSTTEVYYRLKTGFDYKQMPSKVSQYTLRMLDQNFTSFFKALKEWKEDPSKFTGRPKLPGYLDKDFGRFVTTYNNQAISKRSFTKDREIVLSGLPNFKVKVGSSKITWNNLDQVRIVPKGGHYVVEIIYTVPEVELIPDNGRYASIDLGVNNLATVTTNLSNDKPFVVDGRKVKSFNHYYNKKISELKPQIPKWKKKKTTKRLRRIALKRNNKIDDYFHKSSRYIVNQLVSRNICSLIIGNNKGWKQDTKLGKTGNQNFQQIPYYKFIKMLEYKCSLVGIKVSVVTEEYTSKCSFLDQETIEKHDTYLGKRIKRGLYKSLSGKLINADVNGSYNILRKCKPNAFDSISIVDGVLDVVVHPHILCFA